MDAAREERYRRLVGLEEIGPLFAGMYAVAVRLLDSCDQKWALIYIGHCGREMLNRLPEIMVGKLESRRGQEDKAISLLFSEWESPSPWADLSDEDPEFVPVRKGVMNAIGRFVDARREGSLTNRQKSEILATRGTVDTDPPDGLSAKGKEIHAARDWFLSFAHIDRMPERLPDEEEVRKYFAILEEILDEHVDAFFPQREALRDFLAKANQREPVNPSDSEIKEAHE